MSWRASMIWSITVLTLIINTIRPDLITLGTVACDILLVGALVVSAIEDSRR